MGWLGRILGGDDGREEGLEEGRTLTPDTVPVDLPAPDELRHPWAALAAGMGSIGYGDKDCNAHGGDWFYHDGGGNWCRLFRYADGRALLIGSDHEYSETYFREAAEYFGEEETDLLAGGEPWWEDAVEWHDRADGEWISFLYAFDGAGWRRAGYDKDDGFSSLGLPAMSPSRLEESLVETCSGAEEPTDGARGAARAVIAAGPEVTEEMVRALGPAVTEPGVGVQVARDFALPGRR